MMTDMTSRASKYPVVSPAMPAPTIQTSALAFFLRAGNFSVDPVADQTERLLNLVDFLRECFFVGEDFRLEELKRLSAMAFPLIVLKAVLGCCQRVLGVQDFERPSLPGPLLPLLVVLFKPCILCKIRPTKA